MSLYKRISDGYIEAIGKNIGGIEITESEYDEILSIIQLKPPREDNIDYRLKEDLTWEQYTVEPPDPNPEIENADAFDIIFGGAL